MEAKTELERNAVAEERRKALNSFQQALDMQWLNSRMEDGRMGRCLALIQREAEMEKNYHERTDHAAIVNARAAKETALGIEVAKVQREEACKLLRRHYLREKDPSLRELMRKLQAGYICRDLRMQIRDNEYRRLQEKCEQKHANSLLLSALLNDKEAKEAEEKAHMEKTSSLRKDLQQQLVNREKARQCLYEDSLIEKKMLEEVMRTIADEDHKELETKRNNTARLRIEMITFKQARDAWKLKQRQLGILQEREIERQKAAADSRSSSIAEERAAKLRLKEEMNEKIAAKILADEAARLERENIIIMLQEQEYLEKNCTDDVLEREKADRIKRDTMLTLTRQMDDKKRIAHEQKKRDAELRIKAEAAVALENQKEREKELKLKEKRRQYAAALKQQMESNKLKHAHDKQLEENRALYVWDYDKAWRKEVAAEREEIIKEHAPPLLGYLQAGVIKQHDLPTVRQGADIRGEPYSALHIEGMAGSHRRERHPKCNAQCKVLREY